MNRDEQVQAAKTALDLEKRINDLEKSLRTNRGLKFTEPEPQPPVRQESTYVEPPVEDGCRVNWLLMFGPWGVGIIANLIFLGAPIVFHLSCICVIWAPVYYFLVYRKQKKEAIDRILNSAEYKAQCAAAKKAMQDKQCEYDDIYEKAKEKYESVELPQYQARHKEWEEKRREQIEYDEKCLVQAKGELSSHYADTRIVPAQYRNIAALQYIYDMVSTSDYTIQQAIESFDKSEQRKLEMMRLREQQHANALASAQNERLDVQNALLDSQNAIAEKARRDANIAAAVATVQRHNISKRMKNEK